VQRQGGTPYETRLVDLPHTEGREIAARERRWSTRYCGYTYEWGRFRNTTQTVQRQGGTPYETRLVDLPHTEGREIAARERRL
jgi:hypothetical protein